MTLPPPAVASATMPADLPWQTPMVTRPAAPSAARPLEMRIGFDMQFDVFGPTPTAMLLMLFCHPDAAGRLDRPAQLLVEPASNVERLPDAFGNPFARL